MIDELMKNIDTEIGMLREIAIYSQKIDSVSLMEGKLLIEVVNSIVARMKILNSSIPEILRNISVTKKLSNKTVNNKLERITIPAGESIVLNKENKEEYLRALSISKKYLSNVRRVRKNKQDEVIEFQKSRGYVKLANRFFFSTARRLTKKGKFTELNQQLRKANIEILLESYISVIFFSTVVAFILGLVGGIINFIFSSGSLSVRLLISVAIALFLPALTFFGLYLYPSTEKDSIAKRIDQELPFAVIHMSAISGSGIEPTNIFKIIGFSREYPYLRKEIRKILNQINIYGYDLITALNSVAKNTPSTKLSELLLGLSTNISSGGSLQVFFEKRAEVLLLNYRLERENYTKIAETFMDIYITVVIAAPMIFLLMFILLSIGDFNIGVSPQMGTFLLILMVALINVIFLGIIHLKQPSY